jgi:hypothetical protein
MEESIRIKTSSLFDTVFVDTFDDEVWMQMTVRSGTCHVRMTKDQANEMIMALVKVVQALEDK